MRASFSKPQMQRPAARASALLRVQGFPYFVGFAARSTGRSRAPPRALSFANLSAPRVALSEPVGRYTALHDLPTLPAQLRWNFATGDLTEVEVRFHRGGISHTCGAADGTSSRRAQEQFTTARPPLATASRSWALMVRAPEGDSTTPAKGSLTRSAFARPRRQSFAPVSRFRSFWLSSHIASRTYSPRQ